MRLRGRRLAGANLELGGPHGGAFDDQFMQRRQQILDRRAPVRLTIQALQDDILEAYGDPRAVAAQAFRRAPHLGQLAAAFALGKGILPVSISYNVTPRLNTSAGAPTVVRTASSGAI